jgi:hypothetical protein
MYVVALADTSVPGVGEGEGCRACPAIRKPATFNGRKVRTTPQSRLLHQDAILCSNPVCRTAPEVSFLMS